MLKFINLLGQRKVMFTCFRRNQVNELNVAKLAGSVAELSAFRHKDHAINSTIINMAQRYVGSNNLNLLMPFGQFGTRLHGGNDAACPHHISTAIHPLARLLFNPKDDILLNYIKDGGQLVEPVFYYPILPTVLVNGAEGDGNEWSSRIPNYNPREIVQNLKLLINGEQTKPMLPYFKNFRGQIDKIDATTVITSGEVSIIDDNTIEITELPISVWTQAYKETVLEPSLQKQKIIDYNEHHTDTKVRFVVKMNTEQFNVASNVGFHDYFKLQKPLSLDKMVLFDQNGCLKRYDNVNEILLEFYKVRIGLYIKRKEYMEGMLEAGILKIKNILRFITEKKEGKIKLDCLTKAEIDVILQNNNYNTDPIEKWRQQILENNSFDYLLTMPIVTREKNEEIISQLRTKEIELDALKVKTPNQLWLDDMDQFINELDKLEQNEKEEEMNAQSSKEDNFSSKNFRRVNFEIDQSMISKTKTSKIASNAGVNAEKREVINANEKVFKKSNNKRVKQEITNKVENASELQESAFLLGIENFDKPVAKDTQVSNVKSILKLDENLQPKNAVEMSTHSGPQLKDISNINFNNKAKNGVKKNQKKPIVIQSNKITTYFENKPTERNDIMERPGLLVETEINLPKTEKRKLKRVLIFDSDDDEEINVMEKSKKLDLNQASYVVISSDEENRIPSKQPISITCLSSDEDISVDMKDCFAKKNTIDDDDLFEIL